MQFVETGLHFGQAAQVLAQVVGELDALAPFLAVAHLAARQLHHDVQGLMARVVGQVGADAEGAADASGAVLLDFERLVEVQGIAEDDGLGGGVNAELLVAPDEEVGEVKLVARVAPHSIEQLGLLAAQIAQEGVRGVGIRQSRAQVAVIDVHPVFQGHVVGMLVAELRAVKHEPFVRMRAHGPDIVFHGEVAVGGTRAIAGVLLQIGVDSVLHFIGEAAARAELGEGKVVGVGQLHLLRQSADDQVRVGDASQRLVEDFGDDGQQGHFVEGGLVEVVRHLDVQVVLLVQADVHPLRLEAKGGKPLPIDAGQEAAMTGHVLQLFRGEGHLREAVDGGFQLLQKVLRIDRVVAVCEAERALGVWKQLDVGIRSGKLVEVCIQDGMNHIGFVFGYEVWKSGLKIVNFLISRLIFLFSRKKTVVNFTAVKFAIYNDHGDAMIIV